MTVLLTLVAVFELLILEIATKLNVLSLVKRLDCCFHGQGP